VRIVLPRPVPGIPAETEGGAVAGGPIKTKIVIGLARKLINALDRAVESQEALVTVLVENTKALHRIEALLDEQADIAAQTRDAVEATEAKLMPIQTTKKKKISRN
jgi:hypothetical protein